MNREYDPFISKAYECLAGARSELANGRHNNAANRSYYAAYNAAIVALLRAGIMRPRWMHDDVQATFAGQLVARRKLYPSDMRRVLSDLSAIRLRADYEPRSVSRATAESCVRLAERFIQRTLGVERW